MTNHESCFYKLGGFSGELPIINLLPQTMIEGTMVLKKWFKAVNLMSLKKCLEQLSEFQE